MWLLSLVPKNEDGSNFGVNIQKSFIKSLAQTQRYVLSCFHEVGISYYLNRAKLITKVCLNF